MAKNSNLFDSLWKGVIEDLFPDFLRFFYPDADKIFELEKHEFLDKELEKLYPDTDGGTRRRHVDKLVKVRLRKGGEQWILIHIEVQGYADPQFGPRMFQYFYRILDRYRRPVTAIAIFTGSQKKTPESYEIEMLGTRLHYRFNSYRIIDQPEDALRAATGNPFAQIILGARTKLMSGKMSDEELMTRHEWIFTALDKTLSPRKKMAIFAFIKYFVHFSDQKNYRIFDEKLETITGKKNAMGVEEMLISRGLEKGLEKGLKKGREEEKKKLARNLLQRGTFSISEVASLCGVSEAYVRKAKKELKK